MMYKYHIRYRLADRKYHVGEYDRIAIRATTRYSAEMKLTNYLADRDLVLAGKPIISLKQRQA